MHAKADLLPIPGTTTFAGAFVAPEQDKIPVKYLLLVFGF
jgi:hypothetical protein